MPEDRLSQLRKGYAEEDYSDLEPPDLGPLRALAEIAEFAEAMGRLADAHGRPLPPLTRWHRWPAISPGC